MRQPAFVPGRIFGISNDHAIVLDDGVPRRLLLYDRATTAITVLRTLHLEDVRLAKLVAGAAVFSVFDKNQNTSRLYEWRQGVTTDFGQMHGVAIRTGGPYFAFVTSLATLIRRNVLTGTHSGIPVQTPLSSSFSFDLAANGDVVWTGSFGGHFQVFRARGDGLPITTQLTTDATSKLEVMTA